MNKYEFPQLYGLVFENWRFQVNSNWQRSNYFAVFQTALLGAVWEIGRRAYTGSAVFGAILGMLLALIWLLGDVRAGTYIDYWWKSLSRIEADLAATEGRGSLDLVSKYELNLTDYEIEKCGCLRYRWLMRAVPSLFMLAWIWCAGFAICVRCFHCG